MKSHKPIALLLFFFSGLLSLIFQVVWLKKLVLVFGNTVWAVSTLLTAFMAGLAIGSWLFGRIADRAGSPLRIYGLLEGFIGSYGLLSLLLFGKLPLLYIPLYALSGGDNILMGIFKFVLAIAILLPPTTCMGGTLPLLAKRFTRETDAASASIGVLYTINTFGAVFGTCLTGFWLIPAFGLRISALVAASISFTILLVSALLTRTEQAGVNWQGLFQRSHPKTARPWMLWLYGVCGFAALAYEVIWNRILVLHIGSSVYAYSVLLAVYLSGITLGAAIMSYYIHRVKRPVLVFAVIQFLIAFDLILQINQFDLLAENLANLEKLLGIQSHWSHIGFLMLGVSQIIILPTMLFGASFPLAVKLFVKTDTALGQETGLLYAFNTIGTIFGSFCAGFILLPFLGSQRGLLFTASVNLLVGIYLLTKLDMIRDPRSLSEVEMSHQDSLRLRSGNASHRILAGAGLVLLFYVGYWGLTYKDQVLVTAGVFRDTADSTIKLLTFKEDVYATVVVDERVDVRGTWKELTLNGVNVAGTSCELFAIQKLQGHLPLLLHKNPKSVLHIGFGSGGTAYAVSRHPVERITIAEISRSVITEASHYFQEINHGVLNDPRVKVEFTDGRNKVLASTEKYDVILSDSIHPRFSGNGSLYTYEYYQLLKNRLNPGGVVSQWLPFYSLTPENFAMIIKSFQAVFPYTSVWFPNNTLNAYTIVIGKLDGPLIDYPTLEATLKIPAVAADLKEINCETPAKILDFFFFANAKVQDFVGNVPLHTDDNMAVEYLSGKVVDKNESSYLNYKHLLSCRVSVKDYLANLEQASESKQTILARLDRYETATTYNLTGQLLFWEGKRAEAFQQFEKIPQANPDDLEPVEYFGASYQKPFLKNAVY